MCLHSALLRLIVRAVEVDERLDLGRLSIATFLPVGFHVFNPFINYVLYAVPFIFIVMEARSRVRPLPPLLKEEVICRLLVQYQRRLALLLQFVKTLHGIGNR